MIGAVDTGKWPIAAVEQAISKLGGEHRGVDTRIRQAAWVARCVGRGELAPLSVADVATLAGMLDTLSPRAGQIVFSGDQPSSGVWIVRAGQVELAVGSGRRRVVVGVLRAGDVDGDIELLLQRTLPYTARALSDATCLYLTAGHFEQLLATRPAVARRWLSSVAQRLAAAQARVLDLLGRSLAQQTARLLLDEAVQGHIELPQRTLAAMLGAQRPSVNKVLKEFERTGHIAIAYSAIEILAPDALTTIAARR